MGLLMPDWLPNELTRASVSDSFSSAIWDLLLLSPVLAQRMQGACPGIPLAPPISTVRNTEVINYLLSISMDRRPGDYATCGCLVVWNGLHTVPSCSSLRGDKPFFTPKCPWIIVLFVHGQGGFPPVCRNKSKAAVSGCSWLCTCET